MTDPPPSCNRSETVRSTQAPATLDWHDGHVNDPATHVRGRDDLPRPPSDTVAGGTEVRLSVPVGHTSVTRALQVVVGVLVLGTFAAQVMKTKGIALGVARFIDADVKVNLPTGYKVLALATSALLAWMIGRAAHASGDRWAARWTQLSMVIAFLTLDEVAYVHQSLASFTGERSGILHYSWVLLYLPAALVVSVLFLPFVASLPRALRTQVVLAGLLFGGGSGGVELAKGAVVNSSGDESFTFYLTTAVSDSLEMIGLAVLIVALLGELRRRVASVDLQLLP
jgi:hypothetical protein